MMRPLPAPDYVRTVPSTFGDGTGGHPPVERREIGAKLRGFAEGACFAPPRRKGASAIMHGSSLNDKAAPFQRVTKDLVGGSLLGINPDHEHAGGTHEPDQPVKAGLERLERAPSPIDQRDVVLAGRLPAVRRGRRADIAAV